MDDAVCISNEKYRLTYADGLPASCFLTQDTFPLQPAFPRKLNLTHESHHVLASGYSIWGSSPAHCAHSFPSFRQRVHLEVAVKRPVLLSISESQNDYYAASWFASHDNYLAVLMLAWAYILSARWVEVMSPSCSLVYTDSQANHDTNTDCRGVQNSLVVDIGPANPEEARWWAAILAQGQGWLATMQPSYYSPWSINLQSNPEFSLSAEVSALPLMGSASSCLDACGFLNKFCLRHNIVDQSHAALAAVLLFPSMGNGGTLQMPFHKVDQHKQSPERPLTLHDGCSQLNDIYDGQHLDRFLTLSCNIRGIRPMLLSVFYEPSVECNAVTPWLQGTLAAIESLTDNDPSVLGRMCMERTPEVAFIWLGASILGLQKSILQGVHYGQIPIDLHSAVWSRTVQSFIQQPVSKPLVTDGHVQRADECRLLFLSQSDHHTRVPVCQWKPFGSTPTDDVDVEVRIHAQCKDHQLQYKGFAWDCTEGESESQVSGDYVGLPRIHSSIQDFDCAYEIPNAEELNHKNEVISENATRIILRWLRVDGHAPHELETFKHEWLNAYDSDEEEVLLDEVSSPSGSRSSSRVKQWISCLEQPPL
ncbi:uncharacterized protein K460DRAFT_388343 [Cucurbitaria berberidis CBS 394.84]|uniref:Immunoglobulin variable region used by the itc63b heavy chain n=1 Tax=Cucurbitaria berberidis CBS 394.84 TaxID=1168544 RepID=A0A9P4G9K7_9PLEO|nr:uncharacterized protein K460DRAFT_388343 [Cucurbitaria berberidis CBS 394.84]KAF1841392.1 hypothetical protein K460DRAFT_388343 [Cucurbitaria berberidis CBS 394.84]